MKKTILVWIAAGLALAGMTASVARAASDKDVTLTGTMVCAKCKLHEADKCQNVLQVQKDGKTVNYYLDENKVSKDFHDNICQNDGAKATVTGKVSEKGGKEMMVASKVEAAK
jgi:hypothetical protein